MNPWRIFLLVGLATAGFAACGPDQRPGEPCDGPTFNLVLTAEAGLLPPDTRLNVRYGGNQDGEPYTLTKKPGMQQAVFCDESAGGASGTDSSGGGAAGAPSLSSDEVQSLHCRLYTQGPARIDVTATGYEPIADLPLSLDGDKRCNVPFSVVLMPLKPDTKK